MNIRWIVSEGSNQIDTILKMPKNCDVQQWVKLQRVQNIRISLDKRFYLQ